MPAPVRDIPRTSAFLSSVLRTGLAAVEALGLMLALVLLLSVSVPLVFWVSLAILLLSGFVLITGRPVPRIQNRFKGFVIAAIAGICLMASATIYQEQREERLAGLRSTDPDTYLIELEQIDPDRWLAELEVLRPDLYQSEMERRDQEAQAERRRACTDRRLGEAYAMIQNEVRQHLRAPATANFPARYGGGTRYEGDCVYRVVGHVDAQNGFGALLRASFEGRIAYSPDTRTWLTVELSVDG